MGAGRGAEERGQRRDNPGTAESLHGAAHKARSRWSAYASIPRVRRDERGSQSLGRSHGLTVCVCPVPVTEGGRRFARDGQ
jgi:hypothetical protein